MYKLERKYSPCTYLFLTLLCAPLPLQAAGSAASTLMSQAMLSMMDAMGNLAQQYNRNRDWSYGGYGQPFSNWQGMGTAPWSMYAMPGGIPGQQQMQGLMNQAPAAASSAQQTLQGMAQQVPNAATGQQPQNPSGAASAQTFYPPVQSSLDGIWQGRDGEIVLVMYGHFRIYADSDNYRDGLYQIDDKWLTLYDPQSGSTKSFEYAFSEGRMVLRDENDHLLLYRQLPIPVPPYSIFSGQSLPSTQQQSAADQKKE
jgi:hypothetical protein